MSPTLSRLNSSVAVPSVRSDFGPFDKETWGNFRHSFHTDVVRFLRLSFETFSNAWDMLLCVQVPAFVLPQMTTATCDRWGSPFTELHLGKDASSCRRADCSNYVAIVANAKQNDIVNLEFCRTLPQPVSSHLVPLLDAGVVSAIVSLVPASFCHPELNSLCKQGNSSIHAHTRVSAAELILKKPCSHVSGRDLLRMMLPTLSTSAASMQQVGRHRNDIFIRRLFAVIDSADQKGSLSNILHADEKNALAALRDCTRTAQSLLIRLLLRKAIWYRRTSLMNYFDDTDILHVAIEELLDRGLVSSSRHQLAVDKIENTKGIYDALTSDELTQVTTPAKFNLPGRKLSTINSICNSLLRRKTMSCLCKSLHYCNLARSNDGYFGVLNSLIRIAPSLRRVIDAAMYLTFHKYPALDVSLSQELCVFRFPLYDVPSAKKDLAKKSHGNNDIVTIFESASEYPTQSSRLQVDAYLAARNTGAFEAAFETENDFAAFLLVESLILSWTCHEYSVHNDSRTIETFLPHPNLKLTHLQSKVASKIIDSFEELNFLQNASVIILNLLCGTAYPEHRSSWYNRVISNLVRRHERIHDAMALCSVGVVDPLVRCFDRLRLRRRAELLAQQYKHSSTRPKSIPVKLAVNCHDNVLHARALNDSRCDKNRYVTNSADMTSASTSVEDLVLQHYASMRAGRWRGLHSESRVWTTIFSLLFADVIFMPLVNAFSTPFQHAPDDFGSKSFMQFRSASINERLSRIRKGEARILLMRAWSAHFEYGLVGACWAVLRIEDLCTIVDGLGGTALARVMELMACDYKRWRHGAPDLVMWKITKDCESKVKVVEVKSTNDQLNDRQGAWLSTLRDAGVDATLCRVSS